jgi:putative ABC transport system permease protein
VGDEVNAVGSVGAARQLRIVGIVVTPDSAGNGAAMTFDGYAELSPTATKNLLFIRFRKGAPAHAADVVSADNFSPPGALVTPTSVRALQRVTAAPLVLGIVLAVLLTVACAYLLATSVAARARDLAVLRALGCNGRQLRAIIHWQAMLVSALVVVVGLPAGLIVGRLVVQALTNALGIVPGIHAPWLLVLAVPVVALAMANVLALFPARGAAHANVAKLTRDR